MIRIHETKERSGKHLEDPKIAHPVTSKTPSTPLSFAPQSGDIKTITSIYMKNKGGKDSTTIEPLLKRTILHAIRSARSKIKGRTRMRSGLAQNTAQPISMTTI